MIGCIKRLEDRGIDPRTSHMLSERSTIWARPPVEILQRMYIWNMQLLLLIILVSSHTYSKSSQLLFEKNPMKKKL